MEPFCSPLIPAAAILAVWGAASLATACFLSKRAAQLKAAHPDETAAIAAAEQACRIEPFILGPADLDSRLLAALEAELALPGLAHQPAPAPLPAPEHPEAELYQVFFGGRHA